MVYVCVWGGGSLLYLLVFALAFPTCLHPARKKDAMMACGLLEKEHKQGGGTYRLGHVVELEKVGNYTEGAAHDDSPRNDLFLVQNHLGLCRATLVCGKDRNYHAPAHSIGASDAGVSKYSHPSRPMCQANMKCLWTWLMTPLHVQKKARKPADHVPVAAVPDATAAAHWCRRRAVAQTRVSRVRASRV